MKFATGQRMTDLIRSARLPWRPAAALTTSRRSASKLPISNSAAIRQAFNDWSLQRGSPFDLLADRASWTITGNCRAANVYASKEAFLSRVIRPFNARMREPLSPADCRFYEDGDMVIAHFRASGVARDGVPYTNTYVWLLRMEAGLIVEATAFFDAIAFDDLWMRVQPAA